MPKVNLKDVEDEILDDYADTDLGDNSYLDEVDHEPDASPMKIGLFDGLIAKVKADKTDPAT